MSEIIRLEMRTSLTKFYKYGHKVSFRWLNGAPRCIAGQAPILQSRPRNFRIIKMASFADHIVALLSSIGCDKAFGISGGNVYPIWQSLDRSQISLYHFRHESGAAFAAMEYSLHADRPAVVFATSGPGITNAITGLKSARADGARIVFIGGLTGESEPSSQEKRKIQETTPKEMIALEGDSVNQPWSHAIILRQPADLILLEERLRRLHSDPRGGVLGVFLTLARANSIVTRPSSPPLPCSNGHVNGTKEETDERLQRQAAELAKSLESRQTILWVGYGARSAASLVRRLAEEFRTPVMCTPRAKGIFPENHPLYRGFTGFGSTLDYGKGDFPPETVLVLGSRLAELSSSFIQDEWEQTEMTCVDLDPFEVSRNVSPRATIIQAEIGELLQLVLAGRASKPLPYGDVAVPCIPWKAAARPGQVHPVTVMSIVQDIAVNRRGCTVISDAGNSLCWTAHYLRFTEPGRFRTMLSYSAMGHGACGVVGIGLAGGDTPPAIAVVGDGAMLMQSEVSSAVHYGAKVVWLVMNDSRYNMCYQVPQMWGEKAPCCDIPQTDFSLYARALGCHGDTATSGEQLQTLLGEAMGRNGPSLIDVKIDPDAVAPSGGRAASLADSG